MVFLKKIFIKTRHFFFTNETHSDSQAGSEGLEDKPLVGLYFDFDQEYIWVDGVCVTINWYDCLLVICYCSLIFTSKNFIYKRLCLTIYDKTCFREYSGTWTSTCCGWPWFVTSSFPSRRWLSSTPWLTGALLTKVIHSLWWKDTPTCDVRIIGDYDHMVIMMWWFHDTCFPRRIKQHLENLEQVSCNIQWSRDSWQWPGNNFFSLKTCPR